MSTDIALTNVNPNVGLYQADMLNAADINLNHRIDYGQYYIYHPHYPHYPPLHWWPIYPNTSVVATTGTAHRVCGCPNCSGDCCSCADCKVKRLEQRVAELEAREAKS